MAITTEYGSFRDGSCVSVEASVGEALGEFIGDYDVAAIVRDYRTAINEALPDGFSLCGDDYYGPPGMGEHFDQDEVLASVDFWSIVERHDKTR